MNFPVAQCTAFTISPDLAKALDTGVLMNVEQLNE